MTNAITTKKAELQNSKKGFTLVELVVVIAILAILAAIAIPVVNSIINTASKNGAMSNAQSIELAVKEAQSYIASGNTEVYNGTKQIPFDTTKFNGPTASISGSNVKLANAKSAHASIDIMQVAAAKGMMGGFTKVSYNGKDYEPYWDKASQKCIFLTSAAAAGGAGAPGGATYTDLDGKTVANVSAAYSDTAKVFKLASTDTDNKVTFADVKVDNM